MSVVLIDNSFNLRINLGLIGELTGISDCHCFTDYLAAVRFIKDHLEKVKVVFVNPNLNDVQFPPLLAILKENEENGKLKVRILYNSGSREISMSKIEFTGKPITRSEIELLKTL